MPERLHHLDALRAFAMLLGIVLHAALAYTGWPWIVRDDSTAVCGVANFAIHGFRMQLFFLLSGYFTALLWRRRGLRGMLANRARRIALPLGIGLFTIIPAVWLVVLWAGLAGAAEAPQGSSRGGVRAGSREAAIVASAGASSASVAASSTDVGREELTRETQASDAGASTSALAAAESRPESSADSNPDRIPESNPDPILESNPESAATKPSAPARKPGPIAVALFVLFRIPVFHHLWFLWFLCWLVTAFAVVAALCETLPARQIAGALRPWSGALRWFVGSPLALAWLVPLTVVSFAAMDLTKETPLFGADTSTGLLPLPGTLVHYAIFFAFGALLFEIPGALAGFSRRWILALVVVVPLLPVAASFAFGAPWTHALVPVPAIHRLLAWLGPSLYAWLASIALLGLFARVLPSESRVVRYLSDSSYWLYLAHLPLVVAGQIVLRGVAWPPFAKFTVLTVVSTALLLASYEWCVRRTWVGVLLNGKRG